MVSTQSRSKNLNFIKEIPNCESVFATVLTPVIRNGINTSYLEITICNLPRKWGSLFAIRNILPTNCRIATVWLQHATWIAVAVAGWAAACPATAPRTGTRSQPAILQLGVQNRYLPSASLAIWIRQPSRWIWNCNSALGRIDRQITAKIAIFCGAMRGRRTNSKRSWEEVGPSHRRLRETFIWLSCWVCWGLANHLLP